MERIRIVLAKLLVAAIVGAVAFGHAQAQGVKAQFAAQEVIVKYKQTVPQAGIQSGLAQAGLQVVKSFATGAVLAKVTQHPTVAAAVAACQQDPNVEYAEPNYIYHTFGPVNSLPPLAPNDPRLGDLYAMNNSNDADIDAVEAWDKQTGNKNILVAIIDTGIDYDHEDLKANIWRNPGESGGGKENNGIDDDGNGYVDDYRGWDFIFDKNDASDQNGHGTHVAGSIGAVGNNGIGVVGVNWNVSIIPLRFLDANGSGQLSDALPAITYAVDNGAKILSNSWGGGGFSQALEDAVRYARDKGALFVAAAGNDGANNDNTDSYPSNYEVENVIAVAASDRNDAMASFSNYGIKSVDLAAPGVDILSCQPFSRYQKLSGTSMATPHVSGAAALVLAQFPNLTYRQVMVRLLGSVDQKSQFSSKVAAGGRLNVNNALSTNPLVALVTAWSNTTNTTGPYTIDAEAVDDGQITDVKLVYAINGGAETRVDMPSSGVGKYTAAIPGQPLETTIAYQVEATDDGGNLGKSRSYTFKVTTSTDDGGGKCCGALGFSYTSPNDKNNQSQPTLAVANIALLVALVWFAGKRRKSGSRV